VAIAVLSIYSNAYNQLASKHLFFILTHPPRDGCVEPEETFEVLNEVVLSRGANPYLSKIEVGGRAACRAKLAEFGSGPSAELHSREGGAIGASSATLARAA